MKRPYLGAVAGVLATALLLAGCAPANDEPAATNSGNPNGTLTIGTEQEPTGLDIMTTSGKGINQLLLYNVYEGLLKTDAFTGEVVPLLAEKYTVSDDGLVYTFTLRKGVKFHNGAEMTSEDVVWTYEQILAPDSTAQAKADMAVVERVEAPDDYTIEMTLKARSDKFVYDMAARMSIVLEKGSTDLATNINGTGPFKFVNWKTGDSATLIRNDEYWGEPAKVKEVVIRFISDPNALNNAMLSGQLDILAAVSAPQTLVALEGRDDMEVTEGVSPSVITLAMNNSRAPFDDVKVRQAVRYAIDKDALIKTVWAGYGKRLGSMLPSTLPFYEDLTGDFQFNPAKARELLAEAGYPDGLSVTFDVPPRGYATSASQFIAAQLADVGITVTLRPLGFPEWLDQVFKQANYQMSIISHDERIVLNRYGQPGYYFRYDNPKVQGLLKEADAAATTEGRDASYREAAEIISQEAVSDWLWQLPNLNVIRNGVSGFAPDQLTLSFDLADVSVP